jgi:2-oxoglutarate dehydrogenase E2 component (dihydrolipoamide succinyltransferase)
MPVELKVPEVGESISEVQIGQWRKQVGQSAGKDESLVEIESDKATVDLPSPIAGTLTQILKQQGEKALVGEVIGYIAPMTEAQPPGIAPAKTEVPAEVKAKSVARVEPEAAKITAPIPSTERVVVQHAGEAKDITPTGPDGRISKEDLARATAAPSTSTTSPPSPAGSQTIYAEAPRAATQLVEADVGRATSPAHMTGYPREEEYVVMSPIRQRIAQRLVEAQHSAALLTTYNEVDMSAVIALRAKHRDQYTDRYGVKLGFMSFFVKATIDALKLVPQLNAEVREPHIVYRNYYDIGIAVGGGKGLVVPVLRNAEFMSFAEIEQKIADFARRAADNKLRLEELQGGTFTISNGGVYGSMLSMPIVNPPQSGILGLHAIQDRPVALNGQVVVRPVMYVALTYDHRIVDGREAVTFLKRIKETIEEPSRMLLEI